VEQYKAALCTHPLYLTSGSRFATKLVAETCILAPPGPSDEFTNFWIRFSIC